MVKTFLLLAFCFLLIPLQAQTKFEVGASGGVGVCLTDVRSQSGKISSSVIGLGGLAFYWHPSRKTPDFNISAGVNYYNTQLSYRPPFAVFDKKIVIPYHHLQYQFLLNFTVLKKNRFSLAIPVGFNINDQFYRDDALTTFTGSVTTDKGQLNYTYQKDYVLSNNYHVVSGASFLYKVYKNLSVSGSVYCYAGIRYPISVNLSYQKLPSATNPVYYQESLKLATAGTSFNVQLGLRYAIPYKQIAK